MRRLLLAAVLCLTFASAQERPEIEIGGPFREELHRYLTSLAEQHWRKRTDELDHLTTPAQIRQRQRYIRDRLNEAIGPFPARTPLNARVTARFQRDGYRVESVVFESRPNFYITANLYIPASGRAPYPALLGTAGHSIAGKAAPVYQHAWIALAKRGFVVLAFDPIGQGERLEYYDPAKGESITGFGTREHTMAGTQTLLTGFPYAHYMVWDGIRAFDYLLTRKEVDPRRIAVAGNSGGGTQSAYLAVFEPRLASAVVSCYITSWETLWTKPGPQDAEQNFPGFTQAGLNFGDFLLAFAPRPITMLTAIRDFFPIDGARATYEETRRLFEAADAAGRVGYFEYDDEHGWSKPRREATYRWLTRWLQSADDDGAEPPIEPEPESLLNATPTGQLATSFGGETVYTINRALAEKIYPNRRAAGLKDRAALRTLIAERLRVSPRSGPPPAAAGVSNESRSGYTLRKLTLATEPGIRVPALFLLPERGCTAARLYLHEDGKAAEFAQLDDAARNGECILAVDVRGHGESAPQGGSGSYTAMYQLAQRAMLLGKPLLGMQIYDALRAFDYLAAQPEIAARPVTIHGIGNAGLVALLAAALEPRIAGARIERSLPSYMNLVRTKIHTRAIDLVVPGVLKDFDLPDAAVAIAPRPLQIISARGADGNRIE
ncbi:MAG: alpha/beta hydrolase [Bryobacteraceae bacterium]